MNFLTDAFLTNWCGILNSCIFDLTRVVLAHALFALAQKNAPSKDLVYLHCLEKWNRVRTTDYTFLYWFVGEDGKPVSVEIHAATTKESANGILFSNDANGNGTEPLVNSTNGQAHETHL